MSGRRVLSVFCIAIAAFNFILSFYGGKPSIAALWALVALVWLVRTVDDWDKPPEAATHPLRTQLLAGLLLLAGVAYLWFSRGAA